MKILLLARADSTHTQKWATSLADKGFNIAIFDFFTTTAPIWNQYPNIQIYSAFRNDLDPSKTCTLGKIAYLKAITKLKKVIKHMKPDVVHAHYASSYGVLGALSRFSPFFISVWGSDIFDFPNKTFFHRFLLKFALKNASKIFSTSMAMKKETLKYTSNIVNVIPFGINLQEFEPTKNQNNGNEIVIGCFKSLQSIYGIEELIRIFHSLTLHPWPYQLKLIIGGKGDQENYLKSIVTELDIQDKVKFVGFIEPSLIPKYIQEIDIAALMSKSESFGVFALEASACQKAVVATKVGGLPEVVKDKVTGLLVPPCNHKAAVEAFEQLISNPELRRVMGKNGRKFTEEKYDWNKNVDQMASNYQEVLI